MSKRLVFLWDSTAKPWSTDVQKILGDLAKVSKKGLPVEQLDTKDMPEEAHGFMIAGLDPRAPFCLLSTRQS